MAATAAVGLVALGYKLFGLAGAIRGAAVSFFSGRSLEEDAKRRIKLAENKLKEAEATLEENLNVPQSFSRWEEITGSDERACNRDHEDEDEQGRVLLSRALANIIL